MQYDEQGRPAWDQMWATYCGLAGHEGGRPHRPADNRVEFPAAPDTAAAAYRQNVEELCRGILMLTGYPAMGEGWQGRVGFLCRTPLEASYLAAQINNEGVDAEVDNLLVYVPVSEHFTVPVEIKSILTAIGKVHHYWREHLAHESRASQMGAWGAARDYARRSRAASLA
jgi:hypothetical protein